MNASLMAVIRDCGGMEWLEELGRARENGWYQIEGTSRGGGGNYTRYLLTFNGKEYVATRNEGHDFNQGKVEIRK